MQALLLKAAPMVVQHLAAAPRRSCRLIAQSCRERVSVVAKVRAISSSQPKVRKSRGRQEGKATALPDVQVVSSKVVLKQGRVVTAPALWPIPEAEVMVAEDTAKAEKEKLVKSRTVIKVGPTREMEENLWKLGHRNVCGVDEAGRGPLAGPVVAAACIIPQHVHIEGINDSKKMTAAKREELYQTLITSPGVHYAVEVVNEKTIDEINILEASMRAMDLCVKSLHSRLGSNIPDFVLVDGNRLPKGMSTDMGQFVIKGDAKCHVIAAASILAKVTRDRIMLDYDRKYPLYGFKRHKGYGTREHMAAVHKHGPCEIHRKSFKPISDWYPPSDN